MSDFYEYNFLCHHGILGMKWGIRRYQNKDGSLTAAGRARYGSGNKVFVSGSSKTQDKTSGYYRKKLPDNIKSSLDSKMKNGDTILVGDAPGIDRQVQDYLKKNNYKHVTVYATGDAPRYSANKKWETKLVDGGGFEPGTPEFNRQKDIAMTNDANEGIAVILDKGGAKATRNNIDRMNEQYKYVNVFELGSDGKDRVLPPKITDQIIKDYKTGSRPTTKEENFGYELIEKFLRDNIGDVYFREYNDPDLRKARDAYDKEYTKTYDEMKKTAQDLKKKGYYDGNVSPEKKEENAKVIREKVGSYDDKLKELRKEYNNLELSLLTEKLGLSNNKEGKEIVDNIIWMLYN